MKKVIVFSALLAMATASAATFKVKLFEPAVVQGTELKPGEYTLEWTDTRLIIARGKTSVETPVQVETSDEKFSATTVRYSSSEGKQSLREIRLGGTKTKLVINP